MHVLRNLIFAVLLIKSASLQRLSCIHCNDCYSIDRSFWIPRDCDDDSPPGIQTTPGLPIIPQYSANDTEADPSTLMEPANQSFQCFTITQEVGGRHQTHRGCAVRARNDEETCRLINPNFRTIWCGLCDNHNCNSGTSKMVVSSLFLALVVFMKIIV